MSVALYQCDGCAEPILPHKARMTCADCGGNHDICTNCYVVGIYTKRHQPGHSVSLIVQSGYRPQIPPLPPRRQPAPAQPVPQNPPVPQQFMPPPPAFQREAVPSPAVSPPVIQRQSGPQQAISPAPNASAPTKYQPPSQTGWQPLFQGSGPTTIMEAFLNAVFTRLDADKDGLLTPEQYSAFCDVQEYGPDEDVWKKNHKDIPGYTADDIADFELRNTWKNWSIEHRMHPRPNATTSTYLADLLNASSLDPSYKQLMVDNAELKSFSGGMMPMLTRRGFIDLTTVEILYEPSPGWIKLNLIARHYNIWREWGDVPRSMLPLAPPPELVTRVAVIQRQAEAQARDMINAAAVKASLQAQANNNISRLFDPPGTRYVYRH